MQYLQSYLRFTNADNKYFGMKYRFQFESIYSVIDYISYIATYGICLNARSYTCDDLFELRSCLVTFTDDLFLCRVIYLCPCWNVWRLYLVCAVTQTHFTGCFHRLDACELDICATCFQYLDACELSLVSLYKFKICVYRYLWARYMYYLFSLFRCLRAIVSFVIQIKNTCLQILVSQIYVLLVFIIQILASYRQFRYTN